MVDHPADLVPERLAGREGAADTLQTLDFIFAEFVGIFQIERWEIVVLEWIAGAVEHDIAFCIDPVQKAARFHLPVRMPGEELSFELELHDGRRLLHARYGNGLSHPCGLAQEAGGGIVAVYLAYKNLQRLDGNAVTLLQLRKPPVAQ